MARLKKDADSKKNPKMKSKYFSKQNGKIKYSIRKIKLNLKIK